MKISEVTNINRLAVYKQGVPAGYLIRTKSGCNFEYFPDYFQGTRPALSFHISKNKQSFSITGDNLPPFFAGLLPEGLRLEALYKSVKTSKSDLFSLLAASGSDLIGDVSVRSESEPEEKPLHPIGDLKSVSFLQLFEESLGFTSLEKRQLDPSIPGVQPKISAQMISFPLRVAGKNKSFILKLATKEHPRLIENEHFFMKLARVCGIDSAHTRIIFDKDKNPGLLVERFDRIFTDKMQPCQQEDACQFLNLYPQDKYRLTCREIADGIAEFATAPVLEIGRFIELIIFSYLIANGDLHAKNISLGMQPGSSQVKLTKAYDLLSTLPYGDQQMALAFEGKKDNISRKAVINFAAAYGIPDRVVDRLLERISTGVSGAIDKIEEIGLPENKFIFMKKIIRKRLQDLRGKD